MKNDVEQDGMQSTRGEARCPNLQQRDHTCSPALRGCSSLSDRKLHTATSTSATSATLVENAEDTGSTCRELHMMVSSDSFGILSE